MITASKFGLNWSDPTTGNSSMVMLPLDLAEIYAIMVTGDIVDPDRIVNPETLVDAALEMIQQSGLDLTNAIRQLAKGHYFQALNDSVNAIRHSATAFSAFARFMYERFGMTIEKGLLKTIGKILNIRKLGPFGWELFNAPEAGQAIIYAQ